jgi:uncharacterized repeat protein (TIGR03943 family)
MNRAAQHSHEACGCGHSHDAAAGGKSGALLCCALLALWGAVMLYFYGSGRITHYLTEKGPFRTQCLVAGIGLVLLAAANLVRTLRGTADDDPHAAPGLKQALWLAGMLGLPLATATLRTPDRYSDAFVMMKTHAAPVAPAPVAPAAAKIPEFTVQELERISGGRTAEGNIPLGLADVFQLAGQPPDVRAVLESVRIETLGQAMRDPLSPTRWRLTRLLITCCAADARAVSVAVEPACDTGTWRALGWYRAIGTLRVEKDAAGQTVPVFNIETMTPSEPPRNLMIW